MGTFPEPSNQGDVTRTGVAVGGWAGGRGMGDGVYVFYVFFFFFSHLWVPLLVLQIPVIMRIKRVNTSE
jgi:hypothetical protein